jgi:hypothetical protein
VWWNPLNSTGHFSNVTWPSVQFAGWYDIFLTGHLYAFEGFQKHSAPEARGQSKIVRAFLPLVYTESILTKCSAR